MTLLKNEPVAFWTALALVVVTVANVFGVVLDLNAVENILLALPVLAAAFAARSAVTPNAKAKPITVNVKARK